MQKALCSPKLSLALCIPSSKQSKKTFYMIQEWIIQVVLAVVV